MVDGMDYESDGYFLQKFERRSRLQSKLLYCKVIVSFCVCVCGYGCVCVCAGFSVRARAH